VAREATGKVEPGHRTDGDEFYRRLTFNGPSELRSPLRDVERSLRIADQGPAFCAGFGLIITAAVTLGGEPAGQLVDLLRAAQGSVPRRGPPSSFLGRMEMSYVVGPC
jgi:hypothetical protein